MNPLSRYRASSTGVSADQCSVVDPESDSAAASQGLAFALVGLGPGGLCALETLSGSSTHWSTRGKATLLLFDKNGYLGTGASYATDQSRPDKLYFLDASLPLQAREASSCLVKVPAFPSYAHWMRGYAPGSDKESATDVLPTRASVGAYLQARFLSLLTAWESDHNVQLIAKAITDIRQSPSGLVLKDSTGIHYEGLTQVFASTGNQLVNRSKRMACGSRFAAVSYSAYCAARQKTSAAGNAVSV